MKELTVVALNLMQAVEDGLSTDPIEHELIDALDSRGYECAPEAARVAVMLATRIFQINKAKQAADAGWPEAWLRLLKQREQGYEHR